MRASIKGRMAEGGDRDEELRKALKGLRRILNGIELEEGEAEERPALSSEGLDLLAFTRRMIAERYRRYQYFSAHLFSDPAWDILLELFIAEIEMRQVPVTNLCFTSNVPDTTVLRWIRLMEQDGLLIRRKDKVDKRRVLVQLNRQAADAMRAYMEEQMRAAEKALRPKRGTAGLP
jgi:DNA-binding MarR family transcriptional regulator